MPVAVSLSGQPVACIESSCTIASLLRDAHHDAEQRGDQLGGDCEGALLSSRPSSPIDEAGSVKSTHAVPEEVSGINEMTDTGNAIDTGNTTDRLSHEERRRAAKKQRRQAKRVVAAGTSKPFRDRQPKKSSMKYHQNATRLFGHYDPSKLKYSKPGAWVGLRSDPMRTDAWRVEDLIAKDGFRLYAWEGAPTIIVDSEDRIGAVLVGAPNASDWDHVQAEVVRVMNEVREQGITDDALKYDDKHHRRGHFTAIATGVSYGGGGTKPGNLRHDSEPRRRLVRKLRTNHAIQRVAGFQSASFGTFCPKLYQYYAVTMDELYEKNDGLEINFDNSVFPAASFNCGPQTVSLDHKDSGNLSFGMCALTAFGDFDPKRGGHLILFEMKLIIEFPPGYTILLPSSAVTHANTPIAEGETRYSIAQYAAGGLFRWVAYGHRAVKGLKSEARDKVDGPVGSRWEAGLELLSNASELQADLTRTFT